MANTALLSNGDSTHDEAMNATMDGKMNGQDGGSIRVDDKKTLRIQGADLVVNGSYLQVANGAETAEQTGANGLQMRRRRNQVVRVESRDSVSFSPRERVFTF